MDKVILKNINKIYDNQVQAVADFNLSIKDKEFIVIVGPSGCGKSTTLRMIAGLEEITSGEIYIDGKLCNEIAPTKRNLAMVFQNCTLFPHLTVYENMAFGLHQNFSKLEIDQRIQNAAKTLELEPYLNRKPKALSGGQRQRVAIGRAMVRHAQVLLMDEPLSNLDTKLREQMRKEILQLHQRIQATTLYVTHDQIEAMTMADRIVVMKDGCIQQVGTPQEIYNKPANLFVSGFLGAHSINFLPCTIQCGKLHVADMVWDIPEGLYKKIKDNEGKELVLGIRPNDFNEEPLLLSAKCKIQVDRVELLGSEYRLHGHHDRNKMTLIIPNRIDSYTPSEIEVFVDLTKIHLFDSKTTKRIL